MNTSTKQITVIIRSNGLVFEYQFETYAEAHKAQPLLQKYHDDASNS